MKHTRILASAATLGVVVALALAASAQTGGVPQTGTVPAQIPVRSVGAMPMMGQGRMDSMMTDGMMGGPGMMGFGGMMFSHVEGRIAFLKTELKITDAQNGAWNAFADALRANNRRMNEAQQMIIKRQAGPSGVVERLGARELMLSAALENIRAIKTSFAALNAKFSDEQKKTADELLASPMGAGMMVIGRNMAAP